MNSVKVDIRAKLFDQNDLNPCNSEDKHKKQDFIIRTNAIACKYISIDFIIRNSGKYGLVLYFKSRQLAAK
ncbi:hypothetical protein CRP01_33040 [Flavilitoribacter nigricans DSM 23189 = NBRC 102662]|uniref:Uncharacterized protein n=1 Tax=Flavilitoribacter nigricans (strain ATCC 23147 / DSM 23189 / NBRC 102662 / NCIMB 1420 / SS-2) TaxID=1122177 RepID=A0A2D0N1C8_FLAN2|nr:hypothetical protein CRP01_33040 [Flavilitoribacter nigricans DSM 23189 = NBRC 102662]